MTGKLSALILILFLALPAAYGADKKVSPFNGMAFGIAGGAGISHAFPVKDSDIEWKPDISAHFGLILEKMFTNRLGLHTGFWFQHGTLNWLADGVATDAYLETSSIEIPVNCIISFNKGIFSFNILTGLTLSQTIEATLGDRTLDTTQDYLHSINQFQISCDLGFNFKFRVGTYTDIFFGIKTQLYILPLMNDSNGDEDNYKYGAHAFTGVMFRMSTFPF